MTPFDQFRKDFHEKKVLILGLGLQGRGVGDAKIFHQIGARVTVTDKKTANQLQSSYNQLKNLNIKFTLGTHSEKDIVDSDVVIRNASVPYNHPLLNLARQKNIPIKMDACLFFEYARPKRSIGITGTRGKSTTTSLINHVLSSSQYPCIPAGNISSTASLELLKTYNQHTYYVFELSSWQLQAFADSHISPHIAVITNIYPDHLIDRSFEEYIQDKTSIFKSQAQSDYCILNRSNSHLVKLKNQIPSQLIWFDTDQVNHNWPTKLKGAHNLENISAARQVCLLLGIDQALFVKHLSTFNPLEFRLQPIIKREDITIINDTTSTTPTATSKAILTYPNSILILGGTSKNLPVADLAKHINTSTKKVILLSGTGTEEIKPLLDKNKVDSEYRQLEDSLNRAKEIFSTGDTILFSPGFTSFGVFDNEFDRGRQFNQLAKLIFSP